jgi:hypothetical protein
LGKRKNNHMQPYHPDLDNGDEIIHTGPPLKDKNNWKWRLIRFGEKFFGHSKSTRVYPVSSSRVMEMGPTAREGKSMVVLSDPPRYSDAKYQYHYHRSHSSHSHSHSQSHSNISLESIPNAFRDSDIERRGSPRPNRPARPSDEHLLDVPIDVRSSEGRLESYHSQESSDSTIRPRRAVIEDDHDEGEEQDMVQFISSYRNPKTPPATRTNFVRHGSRSGTPSPSNSSRTHLLARSPPRPYRDHSRERSRGGEYLDEPLDEDHRNSQSSTSGELMYSRMTGHSRRMPDVRQPVRGGDGSDGVPSVPVLTSKFSTSTIGKNRTGGGGRRW